MLQLEAYGVMLIPIIIGITEVAKLAGLPKKFAPLLALVLGIAAGLTYASPGSIKGGILVGIALGLSSVGLYSGTRTMIIKNNNEGD
ncbi:hypothetical protein [Lentibacillus saliphilus]|uniref:hypothetical protein n=1 Tax=Lentibacillus saliphilus TaxID=2737028 RepID=UPI001FE73EAF|nr:hypothetical protein [Lentibacillus saliphilus]